jgi:hypothetical protein
MSRLPLSVNLAVCVAALGLSACYTGTEGRPVYQDRVEELQDEAKQQASSFGACFDGFEACIAGAVAAADFEGCAAALQVCIEVSAPEEPEIPGAGSSEDGGSDTGGAETGGSETGGSDTGAAGSGSSDDGGVGGGVGGGAAACFDGFGDCLATDPDPATCGDGIEACLKDQLGDICDALHQQCLDLGAPAAQCDPILDAC